MRLRLVAVLLLQMLHTCVAERKIDDTDENSEDIFERPPRLESMDDTPPTAGVSSPPAEIQFHRRPHGGFRVEEDKEEEENQGSDGFPRLTAMVDEPSIATNETQLLPLPNRNDDRPVDGIRTDTRTGKTRVSAPFPTLMAGTGEEPETIVELTMAPNASLSNFATALAKGDRAPVEYDIEESAGTSAEEAEIPMERNLTAAVIFHSNDTMMSESAAHAALTTTRLATPAAPEPENDTVSPDASHFPTRDRAGIFPSESTEQLTSHGHPTENPSSGRSTTQDGEQTDSPFAMVDPTIFSPDHLFEVPGAPGIEETHEEAKEIAEDTELKLPDVAKEIAEEDSELKEALSHEAHLATTVESIMTSVAPTTTSTPSTTESTTPSTTSTTTEETTTTETITLPTTVEATTMETVLTTQAPVEETTTKFQLPPLIGTPTSTAAASSPSTTTMTHTTDPTHSTHTTTHFTTPEETHAHIHNHQDDGNQDPAITASTQEVHFEEKSLETTEPMPFDPTAAHFGDSQEELWRSTHGHRVMVQTTTTEPLVAHKTPFQVTMRDLDYLPDFADSDSGKFRKLRDQLLPEFRQHFEKILHDFIAVDLTSVEKEKGVAVHGVVYTRNTILDLYDTASKFESAMETNQGRLGRNEVEMGTFLINGIAARAPIERVQQSAGAEGSIAFIVAGIITIGVVVILIVVCVILMNNHRRGVGSIKLKEDAEAEAGRRMHTYGNVNLMSYNSPPPPQPPSTQMLQSLPHVVINTKSNSRSSSVGRPSSLSTSPISPRSTTMMPRD